MFDIGFWELLVIMIVALLVIGPERLPGVARKAGLWVGKGRRFLQSVKEDIDREIAADELKRILKEQSQSAGLHEILEETRDSLKDTRGAFENAAEELRRSRDAAKDTEASRQDYLVKAPADPKASDDVNANPDKSPADHGENK